MDKVEFLQKIKKIIESSNYDIEELLAVIPEELLPEVLNMIKNQTKTESEEIKIDLTSKAK